MDHKAQYHLKQEARIFFCREDSGTQAFRFSGDISFGGGRDPEHRVSMLSLKYTEFLRDRAMIRTTHPFPRSYGGTSVYFWTFLLNYRSEHRYHP